MEVVSHGPNELLNLSIQVNEDLRFHRVKDTKYTYFGEMMMTPERSFR